MKLGLQGGYLRLGSVRGIPVRMHWFMPLALWMFSRFQFRPVHWATVTAIVLLHELGHAFFVRRARAEVLSVDLVPVGGLCRWTGDATPMERALIAWGGVLAQGVVLVAALIVFALYPPTTVTELQIQWACTETNLWMIGLNLLPIAPLDGSKAWKLMPLAWRQWRGRKVARRAQAQLNNLDELRRRDRTEDEVLSRPPAEVTALVTNLFDELKSESAKKSAAAKK